MSAPSVIAPPQHTAATPSRLVVSLALCALLAALLGALVISFRPDWALLTTAPQLAFVPSSGIAPALVCVAAVRWLREISMLGRTRARVVAVLVVAAIAAHVATAISWSIGFDEADAGRPRSAFSSLTPLFAGIAWLLGAAAITCWRPWQHDSCSWLRPLASFPNFLSHARRRLWRSDRTRARAACGNLGCAWAVHSSLRIHGQRMGATGAARWLRL